MTPPRWQSVVAEGLLTNSVSMTQRIFYTGTSLMPDKCVHMSQWFLWRRSEKKIKVPTVAIFQNVITILSNHKDLKKKTEMGLFLF